MENRRSTIGSRADFAAIIKVLAKPRPQTTCQANV
jgi:hypothetical protein